MLSSTASILRPKRHNWNIIVFENLRYFTTNFATCLRTLLVRAATLKTFKLFGIQHKTISRPEHCPYAGCSPPLLLYPANCSSTLLRHFCELCVHLIITRGLILNRIYSMKYKNIKYQTKYHKFQRILICFY